MKNRKNIIFVSHLIIINVLCIVGGFLADIFYWNYVYAHKPPEQTGHGVPFLFMIGIICAIVFSIIFTMIYELKIKNKHKQKK